MKAITRLLLVLALTAQPFAAAQARIRHHAVHHHARHPVTHRTASYGGDYYTAASGHRVHGPVQANSRPSGATARCRDGSWSFSESHRGTCSYHGGVASWL